MDFQQDFNFFKPLITLIFNELQILRILQMKFKCASAKIPQIGWREMELYAAAQHCASLIRG